VTNADPPAEPPAELLRLVNDLEPALVLVGIPIHMDGSEGEMASEAKRFAARLGAITGLPVVGRDERLTSYEAEEMLREMELPRRRRRDKGLRDMLAATLVLRDYLADEG